MLFKPEYDENGKKVLCEMNGIHSDMLMDIYCCIQISEDVAALYIYREINNDNEERGIAKNYFRYL